MTTISTTVFNPVAYENTSPELKPIYKAGSINNNRFDKLFAIVFDSLKVQKLTTQTDLSNMLNTIANISISK